MGWQGIVRARVVPVVAIRGNWQRISTGFLLGPRVVLTAMHGLRVGNPEQAADTVQVVGTTGTVEVTSTISTPAIDVAVLEVRTDLSELDLDPVRWGRVDGTSSGRLLTAEAVGYPLWQRQSVAERKARQDLAEFRGVIRPLEGGGSGLLTIRDRDLETVNLPVAATDPSPWGGLSGAAVFGGSGHLLGVVVQHRPNDGTAALRILPADRIFEDGSDDLKHALGLSELGDVPWAYPDPGHALARAQGVVEGLRPHQGLRAREADLEALVGRMTKEPWTCVVAEAFAGKTALLATLVTAPIREIAVASCFIRRREGLASTDYVLDTLTGQLAAFTWGEVYTPLAHGKAELFQRLLEQAATACRRRGDRLAVVIDGLDEYDPQASVPLRAWLPSTLPEGVSLIVSTRPGRVPDGHPLDSHHVDLREYVGSSEAWAAARDEIELALAAPEAVIRAAATYVTATEGGVTEQELAALCGVSGVSVSGPEIAGLVDHVFDRTLARAGQHDAVVFTHAAYRDAFAELLGSARVRSAREDVDRWVDPMRMSGWGDTATSYALRPYGRQLRARLDEAMEAADAATVEEVARQLASTVSSPGRWLALCRKEGTPAAGDAEVVEAVQAILQAAEAGLLDPGDSRLRAARVALGRGLVRGRVTYVAEAVAHLWASEGQLAHAGELASAVLEPDGRAHALAEVAGGAARAGNDAATVEVAASVALEAARRAGPYQERVQLHVVEALHQARAFAAAAEAAGFVEQAEQRALALARIARHAAFEGNIPQALALVEQVEAIPIVNDNAEIFWARVHAAEACTLCGHGARARAVLVSAADALETGFGAGEWKYRDFAKQILDVGHLRCQALTIPEACSMAEIAELLPGMEKMMERHLFSPRGTWRVAHLAAALAERAPMAARELAEHVVKDLRRRHHEDVWGSGLDWIGATPAGVTGLLIDSGLLDAAVAVLDDDLEAFQWSRHTTVLRSRLARAIGEAGRLDDAERVCSRLSGRDRLSALAWAGVALLARGSDAAPPYLALRARRQVDDALAAAAAEEAQDRLALVSGLLRRRGDTAPSVNEPAGGMRIISLIAELTDRKAEFDSDLEGSDAPSSLPIAVEYMRLLRSLASLEPNAAAGCLDGAQTMVAQCFDVLQGRWVAPPDAFRAARDLTAVLVLLHRVESARAVAEQMAAQLTPRFGAVDLASCLQDTVTALDETALTGDHAARLIDLAWDCRAESSWTWHAPVKIATTFARASPPAAAQFASTTVELVREDLIVSMKAAQNNGLRGWYEPTLQVLTSLVDNGLPHHASEVARMLLDRASDPHTLWFERGAMLGGLVRAAERTTVDEALRTFLTEDAFPDHVDCLPWDLRQQLAKMLDPTTAPSM